MFIIVYIVTKKILKNIGKTYEMQKKKKNVLLL